MVAFDALLNIHRNIYFAFNVTQRMMLRIIHARMYKNIATCFKKPRCYFIITYYNFPRTTNIYIILKKRIRKPRSKIFTKEKCI